jgi:hypothetical protein
MQGAGGSPARGTPLVPAPSLRACPPCRRSQAYYRRNKLSAVTLFQILRAVHGSDEQYKAVVAHLCDVGLLSSERCAGRRRRRAGGEGGATPAACIAWGSLRL